MQQANNYLCLSPEDYSKMAEACQKNKGAPDVDVCVIGSEYLVCQDENISFESAINYLCMSDLYLGRLIKYELKDIPGYEGRYSIDRYGNILSYTRISISKKNPSKYKPKRLSHSISSTGYPVVRLGNPPKTLLVHRLIAITFLKNDKNHLYINHKDGNKLNCKASNLEWCSCRENIIHATQSQTKS
jgi:hypothetical protein